MTLSFFVIKMHCKICTMCMVFLGRHTNCEFNDTSMTFVTLLEYTTMAIFGYRAIADLTCDKIGSHFPIWPPSLFRQNSVCLENMWCIVAFNGF